MLRTTRLVLGALAIISALVGAVLLLLLVSTLTHPGEVTDMIRVRYPPIDWALPFRQAQWALALTLLTLAAALFVFVRLMAMVRSVAEGDPFSPVNARRLQQVGWALLAIQLCDLLFGIVARRLEVALGDQVTSWTPSVAGWLAVLIAFVLARVFQEGARMRDELALTV